MLKMFDKKHFAIGTNQVIKKVCEACVDPCQASKLIKKEHIQYETQTKSDKAGVTFNTDVMEESGQNILIIRDNLTSFSTAVIIPNKTKQSLMPAIKILIYQVKLSPQVTIRVDGQSALASIAANQDLKGDGIILQVGRPKNVNKNGVGEKAIRELRKQMVKINPRGGRITHAALQLAVSNLNDVIRHTGRSACELHLGRDSATGEKLNITDTQLFDIQYNTRQKNNVASAKAKSANA